MDDSHNRAHQKGYARGVQHGTADERERIENLLKGRANDLYHRAAPAGDADEEQASVLEIRAATYMEAAREVTGGSQLPNSAGKSDERSANATGPT